MRIGMIGCGGMGKVHSTALAILSRELDIQVCALADKEAAQLEVVAKQWPEAAAYQDGDGVLNHPGLDAVHICVPTYLHRRYALGALERGLAVFVEKPVCLTPEEEDQLLNAQARYKGNVMVGQVVRFFEEYVYLKDAVDSGRFGRLESLLLYRLSPKPVWGWNNWFEDPDKSGTVFFDLHIHDADFIRYLLGEPQAVRVEGCEGSRNQPVQIVTTYDYGSDLLVMAEGNWDNADSCPFRMGYRANFEKATLLFDSRQNPSLTLYLRDGQAEHPLHTRPKEDDSAAKGINVDTILPYYREIEYFYKRLKFGKAIEQCTLRDAIESVRLVRKEMEVYKNSQSRVRKYF